MTPERLFERQWALAVLGHVLLRLREEYSSRGQAPIFMALEQVLTGSDSSGYAKIAGQLNMTEGAVKVAAHRLRTRYRELLRDEISQTVSDPGLVDEEIRELLGSL